MESKKGQKHGIGEQKGSKMWYLIEIRLWVVSMQQCIHITNYNVVYLKLYVICQCYRD